MANKIIKRPATMWAKLPVVLNTEDVAIIFGLTVQSVRALTRQGKIPATKVGSTYRDEKERLMEFMNAAASVMRDKPCGSKLYMDCPLCGGTSLAGKTRRGDIIARCWDCGVTTWEVN